MCIVPSLCLLLSSCGIYGKFGGSEPAIEIDSLYRSGNVEGDTATLASIGWRELFTDPVLQRWIETGLEKNSNLNLAREKVVQANASLYTARLQFLPSLSLSPDATVNRNLDTRQGTANYSLDLSSDWELDLFGRLRNAKEQAKAALEQSSAYRQGVQTQLVASIAEYYYSLIVYDRQLQLTKLTLQSWQENVNTIEALKRAGYYTEAAVAQAKANLLGAERSVTVIEEQIYELENNFAALIGVVPQSIERSNYDSVDLPDNIAAGVPLEMVNNRPDVREAEYSLASSFYNTNVARSAFYPSITLSGTLGLTNSSGTTVSTPWQWVANAVGQLAQPLFNKGKNSANLTIAQSQQQQALVTYTQTLIQAGVDVNNALCKWQSANRKIENDSQQIESLQSAVRSTQLLMQHGTTNYLEVLTAQQSLYQAQLTEVSDTYDRIVGVIELYHALGGGAD